MSQATAGESRTHPSSDRSSSWGLRLEPFRLQNAGVVYAFLLIVAFFAIATIATGRPFYLSALNTANVLDQTAQVGILAVFMTICLISGNFDLSIGATGALSAGLTLTILNHSGLGVSLTAGVLCGIAMGLLNGVLVQVIGVNAFIVTLGTLTAIRGLLYILTGGESIGTSKTGLSDLLVNVYPLNLRWWSVAAGAALVAVGVLAMRRAHQGLPSRTPGPLLLVAGGALAVFALLFFPTYWPLTEQVYIMFVLVAASWALLQFTAVGRRVYAVGGNTEAARLSGIAVARYRIVPFVLNGAAAALVGILYAARFHAINPNALNGIELTVLAAAILGGTSLFGGAGSVVKTLIGALILFVLANGFSVLNLGGNYQDLIKGVVIIGAATIYVLAAKRGSRSVRGRGGEATPAAPASAAGESTANTRVEA